VAVTLTAEAVERVRAQLAERGAGLGVRVGVKTTGCSGLANLTPNASPNPWPRPPLGWK
jgi:Fe-S cluster assembly iron-binding protein IscA